MIIVITYKDKNHRDMVSHGVDIDDSDKTVIMPQVEPHRVGAVFDMDIGEYIIRDKIKPM